MNQTYYVGGHYGGMSEESILIELRSRGPVLFDFKADHNFGSYKHGVLTQPELSEI